MKKPFKPYSCNDFWLIEFLKHLKFWKREDSGETDKHERGDLQ